MDEGRVRPDFERLIDSLRVHIARDAIERTWARGYAAGKRRSRIEIALISVVSAAVYMWLRS